MPTTRTPIGRPPINRMTPEIIEAWKRADYNALHLLLRLQPWDSSPLPKEITPLGVCEDDFPVDSDVQDWDRRSQEAAIKLQRRLLEIAGWPDCRHEYEKNLKDAEEWADYCRELVRHPDRGGQGTRCDPKSRREDLEEAVAKVAYRRELLAGLASVQRKWARRVEAPADSSHSKKIRPKIAIGLRCDWNDLCQRWQSRSARFLAATIRR